MSDYFERVEAQIIRNVATRARRRARLRSPRLAWVVPVASGAVAILIAVVVLSARSSPRSPAGSGASGVLLRFAVEPTAKHPAVTPAALSQTASVVARRLSGLSLHGARVYTSPSGDLDVRVPATLDPARVAGALSSGAGLVMFDWEANALLPGGASVAGRLSGAAPSALLISQGGGTAAPGSAAAGGLSLYAAVKLASEQPARAGSTVIGTTYYLFGATSGGACRAAAAARFLALAPHQRCLLAGPLSVPPSAAPQAVQQLLRSGLPAEFRHTPATLLAVRQGTVVLEAVPPSFSSEPAFGSTTARYFVLRDRAGITAEQIKGIHAVTGADGPQAIGFGFTSSGDRAFRRITAAIARRGVQISSSGQVLNQHFAIAFGNQLLSVPYIDAHFYPNGISGGSGAEVSGNFTRPSARRLAAIMSRPPLPLGLALLGSSGG